MFHRQRWMLDNSEPAVFETDNNGKVVWVNAKYIKLVKRELPFLLGHGWKNILTPEDRDRVIHNWEQCVADNRDSEDIFTIIDSKGNRMKVFSAACKTEKYGYIGAMEVINE